MSQEKVDKYKEEKKNRAKTVRKAKVKKIAGVLVGAALVGILIGFPLGRIMYNHYYNERLENTTISSGLYDYWFLEYWDINHAEKFISDNIASSGLTDEQIKDLADELSSSSDAIIVSPDDIDQEALKDALESASPSDSQ